MSTSSAPVTPVQPHPPIDVVVFDMGGVIVELGPLEDFLGVELRPEAFWPRWLASPTVRSFERGECDEEAFGHGLCREFDLPLSSADVIERFAGFPRGLYPGAADLVASVTVPTAVLSNTNRLHWEHQRDGDLVRAMFARTFLSYELGLVKPDRAIFDRVVADLGVAAERILFLDDNAINVDGARAVGITAEVVQGVDEASAVLSAHRLLR